MVEGQNPASVVISNLATRILAETRRRVGGLAIVRPHVSLVLTHVEEIKKDISRFHGKHGTMMESRQVKSSRRGKRFPQFCQVFVPILPACRDLFVSLRSRKHSAMHIKPYGDCFVCFLISINPSCMINVFQRAQIYGACSIGTIGQVPVEEGHLRHFDFGGLWTAKEGSISAYAPNLLL